MYAAVLDSLIYLGRCPFRPDLLCLLKHPGKQTLSTSPQFLTPEIRF